MEGNEILWWIIRITLTFFVATTLMLIILLLVPHIDGMEYRADIFAARIAYNGGFSKEPGIVLESQWNPMHARRILDYPDTHIRVQMAGRATIRQRNDNTVLLHNEELLYNELTWRTLNLPANTRNLVRDVRELPVMWKPLNGDPVPALLRIEVLYVT